MSNDAPQQAIGGEFLSTLVNLARTYGWSGDYMEVADFVQWCFQVCNQEPPSISALEPFQKPDED